MPLHNEQAFIARSLSAVLVQDYPRDCLEVIVADGMCDDDTIEVIRSLPEADRVQIVCNPSRVQSAGLNRAIAQAKGEIIVRVDGHTIIAHDYVRQCVRFLKGTEAQNVGGAMNPIGTTPMGKAIAAASTCAFAVPSAYHISKTAQYTDTVYMGAWRRSCLEQLGGFDERFAINEDYELNYRLRRAGHRIYFSPEIRSIYHGRQTLRALASQYFRYGKWKVATLRKHPGSVRMRQLVAPLFVSALICGAVTAIMCDVGRALWFLLVLVYSLANLFFSIKTSGRSADVALWRLLLVFPTIHLSWGIGFLCGLVVFGLRRSST